MSLTVVTQTNTDWNRDLTKCIESVEAALPPGAKHVIIKCDSDYDKFMQVRYNSMKLDDYVVFVDDDDYISPDSLILAQEALIKTDAGFAFTNEVKVYEDGKIVPSIFTKNYNLISAHPQMIHHMCVYNTKYVTERSIECALRHGRGIEWIIKVDAASNAGAIHVPIVGYYWVQHAEQHHKLDTIRRLYANNMEQIQKELSSWNTKTDKIPVWNIN